MRQASKQIRMGLLLNLILMLLFILQSIPSMAQTIIALSNNGFRDGDSLVMRKVDGVQPGMSGRDAVWDFSDAVTRRVHTLLYDLEEDTFSAHEDGTSWRTVVNSAMVTAYMAVSMASGSGVTERSCVSGVTASQEPMQWAHSFSLPATPSGMCSVCIPCAAHGRPTMTPSALGKACAKLCAMKR